MIFRKKRKKNDINLDEIFLDSSKRGDFDVHQFEGRIEKPISRRAVLLFGFFFVLIICLYTSKAITLQVGDYSEYVKISENNRLAHELIFAHRGVIKDRNDVVLAWNEFEEGVDFPRRKYIQEDGFSNLLGFIKYPKKDSSGFYYTDKTIGQDGIEKYFDEDLSGKNGVKLTEVNVKGDISPVSTIEVPIHGEEITLSIDSRIQKELASRLKNAVDISGFDGGAGVIMDIYTGEVISAVTYPEYNSEVLTEGQDGQMISAYFANIRKPSLDRVWDGLYAPGSVVKPFIALGVLQEGVITPEKKIESTGSISIPNPYDKTKSTVFKDWKAHGWTNLREALAVSSDVYFYSVGGGYKDQKGLGITKIDEYIGKFLFGVPTKGFFSSPSGNIPTPEWKAKIFDGEPWVLGNTYHTSIGQYGFLVTPLQIARAVGGIARSGVIVEPVIKKGEKGDATIVSGIDEKNYKEVRLGMRDAVLFGTAIAINNDMVSAGAKTGTAEVGVKKEFVNSWVEGFFPFENPRYAFAIVLDKGSSSYKVSAMQVMGGTLRFIAENTPEYIK